MTYADIKKRIVTELGIEEVTPHTKAMIANDIYDIVLKIFRKAEPLKAEAEQTITSTDDYYELPTDFYSPLQVLFLDADGNRYYSREITYDEYLRWTPNVDLTIESFDELVTDATPEVMTYTTENFDNDGYVGFSFPDILYSGKRRIVWKPGIDGTLKIYYLRLPTEIAAITDSPEINVAFWDLIVHGVVMRALRRKFKTAKNEVELWGLQKEYGEHKTEFEKGIAEFAGFVNKTSETYRVEPFDFLNDYTMLIT